MNHLATHTPSTWILPDHLKRKLEKHPLGRNLFITNIGRYPENTAREPVEVKSSAVYTLLYAAHGNGWIATGRKKTVIKPNQYLDTAGKPRTIPPLVGRNAQFDDILHHLDLMNNIENLLYANFRFYSFLGTFRLSVFNYMKHGADNIIEQCIQLMKQRLEQHLTLADLSREMGLSASYLSALFKEKTRYSPIQLFTSLRMQKASQLLRETNLSVKEIAGEMGYPDQYTFSRSFKLVMGVSPKTFRDKL